MILPTSNDSTIAICAGRFSASDTNSTVDPLKLEPDYAIKSYMAVVYLSQPYSA